MLLMVRLLLFRIHNDKICMAEISISNNRMGAKSLKNGTSQIGSKGYN